MIGVRLGSWIVEAEIGRGGMGAVYRAGRAEDAESGPAVAAIKVLAAELAVEVGFQQRFQREIDILRQLDHPNIVRFYEAGEKQSRFWYAMEFVDGPSYEDLRAVTGRVPWLEVLDLAWQVAPALKHAHDRGIIHRDIKPANLLRHVPAAAPEAAPIVKLTDFGIASLFSSSHLTVTGGVIGTPEYLSPEQASGKPVTRRSDLYTLGVALYTLVTGRTPFTGEPVDLMHKHRFAQFERPSRLEPTLHPDFEEIICNLLEKDPSKRPGDAGVLFRKLDSLRRKIARQAFTSDSPTKLDLRYVQQHPAADDKSGPATLMSRLMRRELEEMNRPGLLSRFFHHPIMLVSLFVLSVSILVWTFWPTSAETLFQRGAELMASADPHDWEKAWERYLEPLETRHPEHAHKEEVEQFRQQLDDHRADQKALGQARRRKRLSEGQWFFEKGLRLRQAGDEAGARRVWQALISGYGEVPGERAWARRAEREMEENKQAAEAKTYIGLGEAIERARKLQAEGKKDEAEAIRRGLLELYGDDEQARKRITGP